MQEIVIGSIPLLAAFIISAIRYKRLKPSILRLFAWFLSFTFCIQIAGYYYSLLFKKSNHWIFNIYTLAAYGFYFCLVFRILRRPVLRLASFAMALLFLAVYAYEMCWAGSFIVYNSFAVNMGDFLVLGGCLLYLSELLMADQTINCFRMPLFWICTGIMFANIGSFLYLSFFNYILTNNLDPEGVIYGVISTVCSVIEYSFFIIAFLIPANE
jgi:hypothetical protein